MCSCLDDAVICEVCGLPVALRDFSSGRKLAHLLQHGVDSDGDDVSLWGEHTREACLQARAVHWAYLVRAGILTAA